MSPKIPASRPILLAAGAALALAWAATSPAGAPGDEAPELDRERVATCVARGGRLARNHLGQMLCKDAKVKLKDWQARNPAPAPAPSTKAAPTLPPAVSAPLPRAPEFGPAPGGTHTVGAGAPQVPPAPPPVTPPHGVQGGGGPNPPGAQGGGGTPPALPPALQPKPATGQSCYLRACLYSSYSKSCQCTEFNSAELCQFKPTTEGGSCANPQGMTTALCPAGTSCVNARCQRVCN